MNTSNTRNIPLKTLSWMPRVSYKELCEICVPAWFLVPYHFLPLKTLNELAFNKSISCKGARDVFRTLHKKVPPGPNVSCARESAASHKSLVEVRDLREKS